MDKKPTILILVGITGDLATRKLLPTLGEILASNVFSGKFRILGVTRKTDVDTDVLLRNVSQKDKVKSALTFYQMDLESKDAYQDLKHTLAEMEKELGGECERLFYLSVPPQVSLPIIEHLGNSGLSRITGTKLLLEKPFGTDLVSAEDMSSHIDSYFTSEQVYHIDHYLTKSMTQSITAFRRNNALVEGKWNTNFVKSITILASESLGIEGRVAFYERTGALRDVVQNHMLALTATMLMDITGLDDRNIPERRYQALKHISIPVDKPFDQYVKRGQYREYKKEVGNVDSDVETYVSITLESNDPRWVGVPIRIVAGKSLDKKTTEITVEYKTKDDPIHFKDTSGGNILEGAYEQVILSASKSNHSLFTSSEEVLESWRIVTPIIEAWKNGEGELFMYETGAHPADVCNQ